MAPVTHTDAYRIGTLWHFAPRDRAHLCVRFLTHDFDRARGNLHFATCSVSVGIHTAGMSTRETIAALAADKTAELAALEEQAALIRAELDALESVLDRLPGAPLRVLPPTTPRARRTLQERILALATPEVTSSAVRLATGAPSHLIAAALRALVLRGDLSDTGVQGPRVAGRGKAPRIYVRRKKAGNG
jgi:hypothetical protein